MLHSALARTLASAALVLTLAQPFRAAAAPAPAAVSSTSASATVIGRVVDQRNALPVKDASVSLLQHARILTSGTTDAFGYFSITNVSPGVYDVGIRANGYAPSSILSINVASGATVTINAALVQLANAANIRTLGTITVSANALASAAAITQVVNVQNIAQTGQIRFADELETLPALNVSTSNSPGDDVTVNIRGFGSSETATLLDGRPVGPLGVLAPHSFNFADTPLTALENVDVTYGSGAQGLYGSDTIAGAINMHLINPSSTPQYAFQQQVGGDGLLSSGLDFTGTSGKLGYVGAVGVSGLDGTLNGLIYQSARPALLQPGSVNPPYACSNFSGTDVSACNQAAETYAVSQDSKLTTELGKLRYAVSATTALTVSAYSAVQWADSTGNGDNDYLPYSTRLGQIQQGSPNCVIGSGSVDNGYMVTTNPITNSSACYTAPQWAAVSYGPDGGGAGRNRSSSMRDFDARLTSKVGTNNISFDTYVNNYVFEKDSSLSGGIDPIGLKLGTPDYADNYNTHSYLLSDDIIGSSNDLGFGYALLDQLQSGQQLVAVSANPITNEPIYAFAPYYTPALFREASFFVRDTHEFGERLSGFLNAWIKKSNVTGKTSFDPRVSGEFRPDSNDVLRLTYGHSDGPPAPELKSTGILFEPDPGSSLTNVACALNTLPNTGGNPSLTSETADDYEFGYGHRFQNDSNVQVNAYVTNVSNQLFSATEPLLQYGLNNVTFASTTLQTYLSRLISAGCLPAGSAVTATYPFLGIGTTYNAASELARGIDLNGRIRFMKRAYIDYAWSVESSQQFNIPDSILVNNYIFYNGGQQIGLPLHQASVSLDVQPGTFEIRLDNYYVSDNNPFDRPAYYYSNVLVSRPFNHGKEILSLGGTNIFNQASQLYGYIGYGQPVQVNQFAPRVPFTGIAQDLAGINPDEEFGLQPAQLTLTLTVRM
jgi:hypothetical protein